MAQVVADNHVRLRDDAMVFVDAVALEVKFGRDGRHAGAATTTLTSVAFRVIWKMLGAFAHFPRTTHGAQRPPLWGVTCLRPSCKREE